MLAPWRKSYDQPRRHIKKQKHYFANKVLSSQSSGLSSSHVWMLELDYKNRIECWRNNAFELWCWIRLWDLEIKEIQPVHPKGNQFWIFTGRTDAEADSPIFWSPDAKWRNWKNSDAGKDWRQEEKRTTEDEIVGWYHQLSEHQFE